MKICILCVRVKHSFEPFRIWISEKSFEIAFAYDLNFEYPEVTLCVDRTLQSSYWMRRVLLCAFAYDPVCR